MDKTVPQTVGKMGRMVADLVELGITTWASAEKETNKQKGLALCNSMFWGLGGTGSTEGGNEEWH